MQFSQFRHELNSVSILLLQLPTAHHRFQILLLVDYHCLVLKVRDEELEIFSELFSFQFSTIPAYLFHRGITFHVPDLPPAVESFCLSRSGSSRLRQLGFSVVLVQHQYYVSPVALLPMVVKICFVLVLVLSDTFQLFLQL